MCEKPQNSPWNSLVKLNHKEAPREYIKTNLSRFLVMSIKSTLDSLGRKRFTKKYQLVFGSLESWAWMLTSKNKAAREHSLPSGTQSSESTIVTAIHHSIPTTLWFGIQKLCTALPRMLPWSFPGLNPSLWLPFHVAHLYLCIA